MTSMGYLGIKIDDAIRRRGLTVNGNISVHTLLVPFEGLRFEAS